MIDSGHQQMIRLLVVVLTGGISSAASIGAYLRSAHVKAQAMHEQQSLDPIRLGERLHFALTNGSTVEGKLVALKEKWVKVEADGLGNMLIPKDQLVSVSRGTGYSLPVDQALAMLEGGKTPERQPVLYVRTEQEAQRALERALRNKEHQQAERLRDQIKQFRRIQAAREAHQKAREALLAHQQSAREERAWERHEGETSFDRSSLSQVEQEQREVQRKMDAAFAIDTGETVVFKQVPSSAARTRPAQSSSVDLSHAGTTITQGTPDQVRWEDSKDERGNVVRKMYQTAPDGQSYLTGTTTYGQGANPPARHGEQVPCYENVLLNTSSLEPPPPGQERHTVKTNCTKWTDR